MSRAAKYDLWSREELILKLLEYEDSQLPNATKKHESNDSASVCSSISTTDSKKTKRNRQFDMSKYSQKYIALKVAYLGWNYHGFAVQADEETCPTVEGQIFKALLTAKLITDPSSCKFSRCGRTDKGVSGLGQVIALKVRSNMPADKIEDKDIVEENVESDGNDYKNEYVKIKDKNQPKEEIPYVDILNRLLPADIRILAWTSVPESFSARFSCRGRRYRYFFLKSALNIELMQSACKQFIGTHDFRNFCKINSSQDVTNYERTILDAKISKASECDSDAGCGGDRVSPPYSDVDEFYVFEVRGTAFLWHQVRCMMGILFLIGQELESPSIIQSLFDISTIPSRPAYEMASELPLILYGCEFNGLDWKYSPNTIDRLYHHMYQQFYGYFTKSMIASTILKSLGVGTIQHGIINGGGQELRKRKYVTLLNKDSER
ncbi:2447_t:CDS:2 [Paraglomus occultum]|uniref:2447_t:CDS:1 n=1 Tax=Paraglomus occultum TaxID=144539 RepID=A0A9N8ZN53_9GLOM|nr:2447_t:CDS:2 [Paraglomus occultum]